MGYYHSKVSNKPDIKHSKSAILNSLLQNWVRTLKTEMMHFSKNMLTKKSHRDS